MAEGDRERWNAKWASGEHVAEAPDPFLIEALEVIGPDVAGRALDLACGTGRHALALARRGWVTSAWDVSDVALEALEAAAKAAGLCIATRRIDLAPGTPFQPDVRPEASFDLVTVVDFLDLALLPALDSLVRPRGWLIYATFAPDWPGEKPGPRFRITAEELRLRLPGFAPLVERGTGGRACLLARRPRAG